MTDPQENRQTPPRAQPNARPDPAHVPLGGVVIFVVLALGAFGYFRWKQGNRPSVQPDTAAPLMGPPLTLYGKDGLLIVQSASENDEVCIRQRGLLVVQRTRERLFTLPAGDYDVELYDPVANRLVLQKSVLLEPAKELILDATSGNVVPQPE